MPTRLQTDVGICCNTLMPRLLLAACVAGFLAVTVAALPFDPGFRTVPVQRLIENLSRRVAEAPSDLEARFTLARVHTMAYKLRATEVQVWPNDPLRPQWPGWKAAHQQFTSPPGASPINEQQKQEGAAHLRTAIELFRSVVVASPGHVYAQLGLGWSLLEAGDKPAAREPLRRAVELGSAPDYHPTIAEEAALYLLPLLDEQADREELALLRSRLADLKNRPRVISPIVVPLRDHLTSSQLVNDDARVRFDVDGTGAHHWNWIHSSVAWLVYDSERQGHITSGLQLFGNVTFWCFWRTGYDALAALDDDGDGAIRGRELRGLALWHDRDGDAVSDPGEVRPVEQWGIVALSTSHAPDATHPDEIPWSERGVHFDDGSVRPTWDVYLRRW